MRAKYLTIVVIAGTALFGISGAAQAQDNSCWGQATAVFAQLGEMGAHSSQQAEPRLGLARLARLLYDADVLAEPTLAALGAWVAVEFGLDIDRCTAAESAVIEAESAVAAGAACWGQASKVFAGMGVLGEHASLEATPRLGLRNLAKLLAEAGVIPDDSMASLGAFVADELGLNIDACQ